MEDLQRQAPPEDVRLAQNPGFAVKPALSVEAMADVGSGTMTDQG
jgi:hypothetical protein